MRKYVFIPFWIKFITAITPVMVAGFGVWQTIMTENIKNKFLETVEENERKHEFAKGIFENSEVLSKDDARAKIALVGLHSIAVKPEDKLVIINLGAKSGLPGLEKVTNELVLYDLNNANSDNQAKSGRASIRGIEYLNASAEIYSKSKDAGNRNKPNIPQTDTLQGNALQKATEAVAKTKQLTGCVYLGKAEGVNKPLTFDDRTINKETISIGSEVETTTSVTLRQKCTGLEGAIKGILPKGQSMKINAIETINLEDNNKAIWALITTQKRH